MRQQIKNQNPDFKINFKEQMPYFFEKDGLQMKSSYSELDTKPLSDQKFAAGFSPFLRGPYSTMYVNKPWTIRQYAGFSTTEKSNAFYRRNLAAGQKGLSLAFDLATTSRL